MSNFNFIHNLRFALASAINSNSSVGRYSLAILLSVLLHVIFLWFPYIHLSHVHVALPELSVRLENLPKFPLKGELVGSGDEKTQTGSELIHHDLKPMPSTGIKTGLKMQRMENSSEHLPIPAHMKLIFKLYDSESSYGIGKVIHQLDLQNAKYILRSERYMDKLSTTIKGGQFTQISQGDFNASGFKPEIYKSIKMNSGLLENRKVFFNWSEHTLEYSKNQVELLPDDAQDTLSYMYQLSQISMQREIVSLPISDGTHLINYAMEIGRAEHISTPMGDMNALHLRKIHQRGEAYFEIWLALEYRMLPVMYLQMNSSGEVTEKYSVSEILVSDVIK